MIKPTYLQQKQEKYENDDAVGTTQTIGIFEVVLLDMTRSTTFSTASTTAETKSNQRQKNYEEDP